MFDILGVVGGCKPALFESKYPWNTITGQEKQVKNKHWQVSYLQHAKEDDYHRLEERHFFILGEVYYTQDFAGSKNIASKRLLSSEIANLYGTYHDEFIHLIKGVFCIFILAAGEVKIFNSKSGMYDIFYAQNGATFVFSSRLEALLPHLGKLTVDENALLEIAVFNYTLARKSSYRELKILPGYTKLCFTDGKLQEERYADPLTYLAPKFSLKQVYDEIPERFNAIMDTLTFGKEKMLSALTSGFDSRSVLSYFSAKKNFDVLYYGWGMAKSPETNVAEDITSYLGLPFKNIVLDDEFGKDYAKWGKQAVIFTNGLASLRRANHFYAYSILKEHSNYNFTGLFGSEVLRALTPISPVYNLKFFGLLMASDISTQIKKLLIQIREDNFFQPDFLKRNEEQFIYNVENYFKDLRKAGALYRQIHYYQLKEGLRNYFGQEVHGCRVHLRNFSPFIDDDFIKFIMQSVLPSQNKDPYKKDYRLIRQTQRLYYHIYRKNAPVLNKLKTGRHYTPGAINSPFYLWALGKAYLRERRGKSKPTFNTALWLKPIIEQEKELNRADKIFRKFPSYESSHFAEFATLYSWRFWHNYLQDTE